MVDKLNNTRILAEGVEISNDTWQTNLNNNDLIIGPSGSGKTTGYVIPNIACGNTSFIIADTKGNLAHKLSPILCEKGYGIHVLDFVNLAQSCGYNPLDYIERYQNGTYCEQDVITIASILCPVVNKKDPFWEQSAQDVIACCIAYTIEALPKEEQNLSSVLEVFRKINSDEGQMMFTAHSVEYNDSFAVKKYKAFETLFPAEKCWASICQFVNNALTLFDMRSARKTLCGVSDFHFSELGERPTVLFVNISDIDRSCDRIINVFYTQAFHQLCRTADQNPDSRLKVPVRIILDDFATNTYIPNFDKIMSVIRSREIYASIILQSISQLDTLYSNAEGLTIINNCDHLLYLGGQDLKTAEFIGHRTNKPYETIMVLPLDKAYVLERGKPAVLADKIKPSYSVSLLREYPPVPERSKANQSQKPSGADEVLFTASFDDKLPF